MSVDGAARKAADLAGQAEICRSAFRCAMWTLALCHLL
jgi:hypothetical protein